MTLRLRLAAGTALATLMISAPAQAQDNAALQRQIDELKAQGFAGNIAIEYEWNFEHSLPEVTDCVKFVEAWRP